MIHYLLVKLSFAQYPERYCDNSNGGHFIINTLNDTNRQIMTAPKKYEEHPHHCDRGVPPAGLLRIGGHSSMIPEGLGGRR